ncbi:4'-phosphopantetheinyl transferase family protein [Bacillus toyonensis]|uniref:4'-phosphopantetheinyl transferase family protein n=1 Tax=Bacillus toyonensis TaxID=155322 RepID=UPI0015967798|nr:4'-phosphopantetheinyl transferase superfamily protein [Bacillus toyonensis]
MILIVRIDINDHDLCHLIQLLPFLEQETQLQVSRLQALDDKKRTLLGNYIAKDFIARCTQQHIENIHFTTNIYGKKIVQKHSISFNISHSGKWVMIALSTNESIGIDVEKIDIINIEEVTRFFNAIEQRYLKELTGKEAQHAFYRIWTAKESFLKCIGKGLSQSLDTFIVPLQPSSQPQVIEDRSISNIKLQVYSFQIDSEHFCSVCTKNFPSSIDMITLSKDFSVLRNEQLSSYEKRGK